LIPSLLAMYKIITKKNSRNYGLLNNTLCKLSIPISLNLNLFSEVISLFWLFDDIFLARFKNISCTQYYYYYCTRRPSLFTSQRKRQYFTCIIIITINVLYIYIYIYIYTIINRHTAGTMPLRIRRVRVRAREKN